MKLAVVCCDHPLAEGTSAGRSVYAWCEGAMAAGHEVAAWCWNPNPPSAELPRWCEWEPVRPGGLLRAHIRGILWPRADTARRGWPIDPDAVAVADDVPSFAAVAGHPRSVVTVHYRALMDAAAVRRLHAAQVQTARAERRAGRRARLLLAYSHRVGLGLGSQPIVVPIAYPVPGSSPAPVDEPTVGLLADWSWRPNLVALATLLKLWPEVHDQVAGARLLLGGRNLPSARIGHMAGVEVVGTVRRSVDFLDRCAVVAFPCPPSSGPKTKVLEALAYARPVVTTPSGAEGVCADASSGVFTARVDHFAGVLSKLLVDPETRSAAGKAGREKVREHHSGTAVAEAKLTAFSQMDSAAI